MRSGLQLAGRYLLQEPLGRGGMGEVWRGRDDRLHRPVAVKILPLATGAEAERDAVARFRREAEIAANLNHPGITTVFDIDEHVEETGRSLLFLVMELLQGRDLHAVIAEHPGGLPIEQVTEFSRQILEALGAAHDQGVTHRDIKPANLFLLANGRVKVCDFGIARLADATRITSTGGIAGTPLYMAPEQIQGRPTDQRTDLYAFGCVLYELLTGASWVDTGSGVASLLYQHIGQLPAAPGTRRPETPEHLDRLVSDLLAKDPADRPPTAKAALALLDAPVPAGGFTATDPAATIPLRAGQPPADPLPVDPLRAGQPPVDPLPVDPPPADPGAPPPTAPSTAVSFPASSRRRTWRILALTGVVVVLGAVVLQVATRMLYAASNPVGDVNPLHKDETRSGTVLAVGDMARIPFIYNTSLDQGRNAFTRITLGVTVTSITRDPGPATESDFAPNNPGEVGPAARAGYDTYCVHFRTTNLGTKDMPAELPTTGSAAWNPKVIDEFRGGLLDTGQKLTVQGKPLLLMEGVLSDGTLTNEQHIGATIPQYVAYESPTCRPHSAGTVAPGHSVDQGEIVFALTGSNLTVTGARWTEPTTTEASSAGNDISTYSVQWK